MLPQNQVYFLQEKYNWLNLHCMKLHPLPKKKIAFLSKYFCKIRVNQLSKKVRIMINISFSSPKLQQKIHQFSGIRNMSESN